MTLGMSGFLNIERAYTSQLNYIFIRYHQDYLNVYQCVVQKVDKN